MGKGITRERTGIILDELLGMLSEKGKNPVKEEYSLVLKAIGL